MTTPQMPMRRLSLELPLAITLLAGAVLAYLAVRLGPSGFSPDSWAYFELAKTIFGDDFYRFNTYRTYFSDSHSASFPFGYPVLVAAAQSVLGVHPMVAVAVNIAAAVGTALLIVSIGRRSGIPGTAQAALVLSLLFYDGYLNEVLFGRSIPVAILGFVGAFRLLMAGKSFAAGLLLGLAALVRFDFLAYGLLFLAAMPSLGRRPPAQVAAAGVGFLLGACPWAIYSLAYFGKPWISDSSWIVWSAAPAYVADYPAAAARDAFSAPGAWLLRVLSNCFDLVKFLISWALRYPLAIAMALFAAACWATRRYPIEGRTLGVFGLLLVSLLPNVLTRYFDDRYFALLFLTLCFFLATRIRQERILGLGLSEIAVLSIVATLALEGKAIDGYFRQADQARENASLEERFIASLRSCQQANPEIRYIFMGEAYRLAPRYGATTGGRAAFIPSNFQRMSEPEKEGYLEKMKPYALIDKITENYPCHP